MRCQNTTRTARIAPSWMMIVYEFKASFDAVSRPSFGTILSSRLR